MKNCKGSMLMLALLAVTFGAHGAFGQPPQMSENSVQSSRNSDIPASEKQNTGKRDACAPVIDSCSVVVDELKASRVLIDALETENAALKARLETEKRAASMLAEINDARKSETEALRAAVAAKNETIAAKDAVIAAQDKLIENLKTKKTSVWKRIADIAVGAAIGIILK